MAENIEESVMVNSKVDSFSKDTVENVLSADELEIMNALRKPGTLIWHKKYDVGEVLAADDETARIRFDNGKESDFKIRACAVSGLIRIL